MEVVNIILQEMLILMKSYLFSSLLILINYKLFKNLKTMDTSTVITIIEMIDARLANLENTTMHVEDYLGAERALTELQNHLYNRLLKI